MARYSDDFLSQLVCFDEMRFIPRELFVSNNRARATPLPGPSQRSDANEGGARFNKLNTYLWQESLPNVRRGEKNSKDESTRLESNRPARGETSMSDIVRGFDEVQGRGQEKPPRRWIRAGNEAKWIGGWKGTRLPRNHRYLETFPRNSASPIQSVLTTQQHRSFFEISEISVSLFLVKSSSKNDPQRRVGSESLLFSLAVGVRCTHRDFLEGRLLEKAGPMRGLARHTPGERSTGWIHGTKLTSLDNFEKKRTESENDRV
uniref:Uncharacterized protein n=1 Tax=Vespula pensylvanica TaxID=30213 RepID=A0A834NS15_VESPE|nr:hypothetical protein H0235_011526 [Vespula pensylvanica]